MEFLLIRNFHARLNCSKDGMSLSEQHPDTIFILPHFGNYAENIQYVSDLLAENPNVYIDFSARIDELGTTAIFMQGSSL